MRTYAYNTCAKFWVDGDTVENESSKSCVVSGPHVLVGSHGQWCKYILLGIIRIGKNGRGYSSFTCAPGMYETVQLREHVIKDV